MTHEKLPPTEDDLLAEQLRAAISTFVRKTREAAATPTNAQSEMLGLLERFGALSAAALARHRGVTHQSMRVTASELMEKGQVTMTPDPEDGRSKLFELTPAGHETLHTLRLARSKWLAENWVSTLTQAERGTIKDAIELLHRVA